jgi:predicted RNA-binding Zn-ribbon protein involved in translation (DUF1610 family)
MKSYNIADILSLEGVYLKMRPWIENHPNVAVYIKDQQDPACPKCGGKVQKRGFRVTNLGKYQSYQCQNCHGWSRDRHNLNAKEKRSIQLVN